MDEKVHAKVGQGRLRRQGRLGQSSLGQSSLGQSSLGQSSLGEDARTNVALDAPDRAAWRLEQ
jgi:hypothetical protein